MSAFVLDCSIAVAWLFEDEAKPQTDALLDRLKEDGAHVSGLWRLEIGNVLASAERRNRITAAQVSACLGLLERLPIVTDAETESRALREILALARSENLTTYDASYLELALRRGMELATLDKPLIRAADRFGINTAPSNAP